MTTDHLNELAYRRLFRMAVTGRLSRRDLIKRAGALGLGVAATSTLLAACGDDDDPTATPGAQAPGPDPTATAGAGTTPEPEPEDEETPEAEATEPPMGATGGVLNVALNSDLTTMDPHRSTAAVDRQVYQLIYDKLVDIDETLTIVPELASEWAISDDGMEYTFTLVEGVTFHDGEAFNAEAVKFNFDRMLDEETASPRRSEIAQITEVVVEDEHTVRLVLSQPFSPLLATLSDRAGMMVSPKAIEELGEDLARQPVGTGAFTFVEWMTSDHLTVERYDGWWQEGLPHLDQVIYRPIVDANVKLTALRTGDVDIIDTVSARDVAGLRDDDTLEMSEIASLGFTYITLNNQIPPFDNIALRQAVAWTIDR
ncbi:MAG TPA: ABC transporter substrate-binding protein, partial [Thermomicrobiales bacterium]|nr:ABC transporter substrate-binding protein [Thermomicrobiales bacterium]